MRKWLSIVAVTALVAVTGVQAQNQGGGPPPGGGRGGGGRGGAMGNIAAVLPPTVVDQLALTADQQAKLKDLDAKFLKERDALLAKQKAASNDLAQVALDMQAARGAGDQAKAQELRAKGTELRQPQLDLQKKYQDQFRASLTDEQKKKLDDALLQQAQRRGGRRGGAPGGAPPPAGGGGN